MFDIVIQINTAFFMKKIYKIDILKGLIKSHQLSYILYGIKLCLKEKHHNI